MKLRLRFADHDTVMTATLRDGATTRDFLALLPLTETFEDYAGTEKIYYLPTRLSIADAAAGSDPAVGDVAYYAPWRNLAIFYRDAGYANGLVILGRIDGGLEALAVPGAVRVTIEADSAPRFARPAWSPAGAIGRPWWPHEGDTAMTMTTWTRDELDRIGAAEELQIAALRRDGTLRNPVTIWVVRVGDDLYVRSASGRNAAWFRATQVRHGGHIRAGGIEKDVTFVDVKEDDRATHDQLDTAYRSKYRRYPERFVNPVVSTEARSVTLRLVPRPTT